MSLQKKKLAFLSIVNSVKGFVRSVVGLPPLTLPNCVDDKSLLDCKIYGNSMQNGKNLLQYDIKTTTSSGVTWTVNEDRSITVSGTPSAFSGFTLINQVFDPNWVGKIFTFYYTGVDIANAAPVINFYRADGTSFTGDKFNHSLASDTLHIFTVPDEAVKIALNIQRRSNNVECTGTFYPMLLMGEYTAETLPEFANTFPSPDNPIEIESVGEKTSNILDVANAPIVFSTRAANNDSIRALFERTSTGFKGSFYKDLAGGSQVIGYILGRTEDFKGKTITVSFNEVIVNPGAIPYIAIYATSKQGVSIDKMDENTSWNDVINGYIGGSTNIRIGLNDTSYQEQYLITRIPEDIDSEAYPYLYTSFYLGYGAESNPAGSIFEYKGIKVEVASNENVFDVSKATVLKRLSDSTAEFDGNELVITKTRDTAQERTVLTIPTTKKNTRINVTIDGGDGTSQYGIYMTDEIPTSPTVITTHSVNTDDYAYINIVVIIATNYTGTCRYNIILNECGSADYEPYGYKIPVVARGENLFNSIWEKGFLNINTGKIDNTSTAAQEQVRTPHYTKLLGGTNYYLSSPTLDSSTSVAWYYYDADKNFISRQVSYNNRKITPPDNTEYVKLVLRTTSFNEKIQIEEGSTATDYEPYVEPITTNVYTKEPIRRLNYSTGYADHIDLKNSKIVRNIDYATFNNNDTLCLQAINSYGIANFYIKIAEFENKAYALCNSLIVQNSLVANTTSEGFILSPASGNFYFYIRLNSERASTVDELNEWLKTNEIYAIYVLAEPTEETIDTSTLPTFKGTTIYEVDTSIKPSNMEVTYYSTSKE